MKQQVRLEVVRISRYSGNIWYLGCQGCGEIQIVSKISVTKIPDYPR